MLKTITSVLRLLAWPVTVGIVAIIALVALSRLENDLRSALFALCGIGLLAALLLVASRRIAFSVYSALALGLLVALPSMVKARMTGMSLHSFDLALLADPQMLGFFLTGFGAYAVPVLAIAACMIAAMTLIYRFEQPVKLTVKHAVLLVAAPLLMVPLALPGWASEGSYLFQGRHISALMVSLRELPELWADHPLTARVKQVARVEPYDVAFQCDVQARKPDVVIVHAESQLPPEWMGAAPIAALRDTFKSQDGVVHRFGTETYGGGSWITVSSVMAGLSGADFGRMRQFIAKSLVGNVRASVPEILSQCGYDTTALLGMAYDQFSLGPLLTSLGIEEVHDPAEVGIASMSARDALYFDAALKRLKEKRAASARAQFLYVETMFTHSPYDETLEPEMVLDGEPFSADPVENEYLRRLVIARHDLDAFKEQIAKDPGPNGIIVLEYGDHRPMVELDSGTVQLADWRSEAYDTYFSFRDYGAAARPLVAPQRMDAAFLGYWLIEAGGIAKGGIIDDMAQLRERCGGRFHLCDDAGAADAVLSRRVESGLLTLRPLAGTSATN